MLVLVVQLTNIANPVLLLDLTDWKPDLIQTIKENREHFGCIRPGSGINTIKIDALLMSFVSDNNDNQTYYGNSDPFKFILISNYQKSD